MRRKLIGFIFSLIFIGGALAFTDSPYARRIRPFTGGFPGSCIENEIGYDMTSHVLKICTNSGWTIIASGGSVLSGSGTTGVIPYFSAASTLADSPISRISSTNVAVRNLQLGTASSTTGQLILFNSTNAFTTTISSGVSAASRSYIWPTNFGSAGTVLTDAAGNGTLSWAVAGISGSGTLNTIPKFTPDGTHVGNSQISDDGIEVGISSSFGVNTNHIDYFGFSGGTTGILSDSNDGGTTIGDWNGNGNSTAIRIDDNNQQISFTAGNVVVIDTANIFPNIASTYSLGIASKPFASFVVGNAVNNSSQITGTFTANRTATLPDKTGTVGILLTANATLNFANLAAIGCEDLTVTVTGAADGDTVSLAVPNASIVANGNFFAWVSAANTVTVRFCTVVSGDPASGSFRVDVWKH